MRDGTETKDTLERAALHRFLADGIAGASMRDIVKDAGISLGAVYNHYKSKEDLALALFTRSWTALADKMLARARAETGLAAQLRAMIAYLFEEFDDDPDRVGFVFVTRHDYVRRLSGQHPHGVFRRFFAAAMDAGEARRMDADVATALVMGAVIQTIDAKMLKRIKGDLSARADDVADACYRILAA